MSPVIDHLDWRTVYSEQYISRWDRCFRLISRLADNAFRFCSVKHHWVGSSVFFTHLQHLAHCISSWTQEHNIVGISKYASKNIIPVKQPTPASCSAFNKPSIYTQNNTGLSTAPCLTPFITPNHLDCTPYHTIRVTWFVYIESSNLKTMGGSFLSIRQQKLDPKFQKEVPHQPFFC